MGKVIAEISTSLDGYVAGPNPTLEEPLGRNGERLHEWVVGLQAWREPHGLEGGEQGEESERFAEAHAATGAVVMGRRMFSGGAGPWEEDPKADGWWGDEPPFHTPVFVLTHHAREPVQKLGGTSYTFVTDGITSAVEQARSAAGERNVQIAGGADVVQQALRAALVDELRIHVAPVLLGGGTRLLDDVGGVELEQAEARSGSAATHLTYRVVRQ